MGYGLISVHSYLTELAESWAIDYFRSLAMFFWMSGIASLSMCVYLLFIVCLSRNQIRRSAVLIGAGGR